MKRWFSIGALLAALTTGCAFGGGPDDAAPAGTLAPPPMLGATAVTAEDEHDAELVCRYLATLPKRERSSGLVFMKPAATDLEIATVRAGLGSDPAVSELTYTDHLAARAELATMFPEISNADSLDPEVLPTSFRFRIALVDGKVAEPASFSHIRRLPGVNRVTADGPITCDDVDPAMISAALRAQQNRFGAYDVRVFLHPGKPEAVAPVREQLLGQRGVGGIDFISEDESLAEFRCLFWDDAEAIGSVHDAKILPPSFRVDAGDDPDEIEQLAKEIGRLPGVKETTTPVTKTELVANLFFGNGQDGDPRHQPDCPVHSERIR